MKFCKWCYDNPMNIAINTQIKGCKEIYQNSPDYHWVVELRVTLIFFIMVFCIFQIQLDWFLNKGKIIPFLSHFLLIFFFLQRALI
jgi:hypothetical protein